MQHGRLLQHQVRDTSAHVHGAAGVTCEWGFFSTIMKDVCVWHEVLCMFLHSRAGAHTMGKGEGVIEWGPCIEEAASPALHHARDFRAPAAGRIESWPR